MNGAAARRHSFPFLDDVASAPATPRASKSKVKNPLPAHCTGNVGQHFRHFSTDGDDDDDGNEWTDTLSHIWSQRPIKLSANERLPEWLLVVSCWIFRKKVIWFVFSPNFGLFSLVILLFSPETALNGADSGSSPSFMNGQPCASAETDIHSFRGAPTDWRRSQFLAFLHFRLIWFFFFF